MGTNLLRGTGVAVAVLGVLFGTAAWAETRASQVTDAGSTIVVYQGLRIQVAVSDRYARYYPRGQWLLLDTEMSATGGPISIPRSAFAVRTPGRHPLHRLTSCRAAT